MDTPQNARNGFPPQGANGNPIGFPRASARASRRGFAPTVLALMFLGLFGTAVCHPASGETGPSTRESTAPLLRSHTHTAPTTLLRPPPAPQPDTTIPNWFGQTDLDARFLPPGVDEYADHGQNVPGMSRDVFRHTNKARRSRDRTALAPDRSLSRIACRHNNDMMAHDYMGHEDSDGRGPGDRVAREHRQAVIKASGENVLSFHNPESRGAALAEELVDSWMGSPPHRKNILKEKYTHLGTCVTVQSDTVRATQVFAKIGATLNKPLPWSMAPGDSLALEASPVQSGLELNGYSFEALEGSEEMDYRDIEPLTGMIHIPRTAGLHSFQLWTAKTDGNTLYYDGVGGGPYLHVQTR